MGALSRCRTAALGGHVCACEACGAIKVFYNSCRDRHCPKCQSLAREQWVAARRAELLPVPYFHLVFTVPPVLHDLLRYNERLGYGALFAQAWSSLRTLCAEAKYLGGRTGMLAVLHTWGQNLHYHPHVHALVPAGGLSFDGRRWIKAKHKNYLVPVRALSRLFRGRLVSALRALHREGELNLPPGQHLGSVLNAAMATEWVVYAKPPFGNATKLVDYLGRYIKRVAISNDRIISIANGRVRFRYRDYADADRLKAMELSAEEFIRRFLQHVLPSGFHKIRYYGLFAVRDRHERLAHCHRLLNSQYRAAEKLDWRAWLERLTGQHPDRCGHCRTGRLVIVDLIRPVERAPPVSFPAPGSLIGG